MNCPLRVEADPDEGHNQNPSDMAPEAHTHNTLNHRANSTHGSRNSSIHLGDGSHDSINEAPPTDADDGTVCGNGSVAVVEQDRNGGHNGGGEHRGWVKFAMSARRKLIKYSKFIGPGFMVSVSYIDPGRSHLYYDIY
jgi:metal iron transporter